MDSEYYRQRDYHSDNHDNNSSNKNNNKDNDNNNNTLLTYCRQVAIYKLKITILKYPRHKKLLLSLSSSSYHIWGCQWG